jgi:hypothetical protein
MNGSPPTADEAQALHLFLWNKSNKREWEVEARKTHEGDKKRIKILDHKTWKQQAAPKI